MICKTLTNTTFCDNQFNFNNCFIIELKLLAIKKIVFVSVFSCGYQTLSYVGGVVLFCLPCRLFFFLSSFLFLPKWGRGAGSLDRSLVLHAISQ